MTEPRRVAVFSSSRADLGPLGPVINALDRDPRVTLSVLLAGTHFSDQFGGRGDALTVHGDSSLVRLDVSVSSTDSVDLGVTYGQTALAVSQALATRSIDVIVLLGDRWELLAAAGAALIHGVAIAHLHGGETTEGAIDERIRHGITKLADVHLCATEDSARRIRQLGEEPRRITVTGAPGLDRLALVDPLDDEAIAALIGRAPTRPLGVVVHHPTTLDRAQSRREAANVFEAAASRLSTVVALYPGADPGADAVIDELDAARRQHDHVVAVRNLGDDYLRLLAAADVLIGNSSSGIIEAASLRLPVVNIGIRQAGRVQPRNVINAEGRDCAEAIGTALSSDFRVGLVGLVNPYGDGHAAERIVERLVEIDLKSLLVKPMVSNAPDVALDQLVVDSNSSIRTTMATIDRGAKGIALVVDDEGRLLGTATDGDLRRSLLAGVELDDPILEHFGRTPVVATTTDDADTVLGTMLRHSVQHLPVVDAQGRLVGLHAMSAIVGAPGHGSSVGGAMS